MNRTTIATATLPPVQTSIRAQPCDTRIRSRAQVLAGVIVAWFIPWYASAQAVRWTTNYYSVTGAHLAEVRRSLNQSPPWQDKAATDGLTAWEIEWQFSVVASTGGCRCRSFSTKTTITTTLPRWVTATNAPPEVQDTWGRYLRALADHETGHAWIALAAAAEQSRRITELRDEPDCDALKKKIDDLARQIVDANRKRDEAYDQRTAHGATQGARFPGPGWRRVPGRASP